MELPLPIPNRAVKRASADNSTATRWHEDKSWPGKFCLFSVVNLRDEAGSRFGYGDSVWGRRSVVGDAAKAGRTYRKRISAFDVYN